MKKKLKFGGIIIFVVAIFVAVILAANNLAENSAIQSIVGDWGYFGVLIVAIIAGLNTFVPLPSATFAPIFLAAGLSIIPIIMVMAIGTLIADGLGFALGHASRELVKEKYPRIFNYFYNLQNNNKKWVLPLVICYAAFVPFPNEAILIPLALAGAKFRNLLIPLIVGNIAHQALLVYLQHFFLESPNKAW